MSLTEYLGRLRSFVDALHAEAATVVTYVRRLEGQDRERAFGWASILERARTRLLLVVEHWLRFNQELDGRVYPDDVELRAYGQHHKLRYRFAETCPRVLEAMDRLNRYIDDVERFDRQDVQLISALVKEIISLLREEAAAARQVGLRLMRTATDSSSLPYLQEPQEPREPQEEDEQDRPYPEMSLHQATRYLEQYTAARRIFEEELQGLEAA